MVHVATDVNLDDCYQGWCACGWTSPPYTEIEAAQLDCWQHSFGWRISDLRLDPEEISSNGNGRVNGHHG